MLSVILFTGSRKIRIWTGITLALTAIGVSTYYLSQGNAPSLFSVVISAIGSALMGGVIGEVLPCQI